eukprot:scaffold58632_cov33-Tisochrysis_lutea.AAC.1
MHPRWTIRTAPSQGPTAQGLRRCRAAEAKPRLVSCREAFCDAPGSQQGAPRCIRPASGWNLRAVPGRAQAVSSFRPNNN